MLVEIDVRKSARQNAAIHFERSKKAMAKAGRGRALLLAETGKKAEKPPSEKGKARRQWFEKFRHFVSSEGNLVLAGRDAATNELLVKRHAGKDDAIFHADPSGSPFVVVRGACGPATLAEAATFCASCSRAWAARIAAIDVYWVRLNQVSKKAPAGEFVPRGGFMIYGRKNYFRNTVLELAVFLGQDGEPVAAPPAAAPAGAVVIAPGGTGRAEAVKEIKRRLGFSGRDDDIDKIIPPGKLEMREDG